MPRMRTLIVDNDCWFRQFIKELLAPLSDIEIVGEAVDGQEAINKTRALKPHLVLMDVRMPHTNGLKASHILKIEMPDLKIIILTVFDNDSFREAALAAGVNAYLVKQKVNEELIPAIEQLT